MVSVLGIKKYQGWTPTRTDPHLGSSNSLGGSLLDWLCLQGCNRTPNTCPIADYCGYLTSSWMFWIHGYSSPSLVTIQLYKTLLFNQELGRGGFKPFQRYWLEFELGSPNLQSELLSINTLWHLRDGNSTKFCYKLIDRMMVST